MRWSQSLEAIGVTNGDLKSAAFNELRSICGDPRNPQSYWVGDQWSIRYCDGKTITLLAGGKEAGYQDGTGQNARFNGVNGIVCPQNGDKLFVTDCDNNRIRMVDTKTGEVKTVAGNGREESNDGIGLAAGIECPRQVVFYRSPTAKPDSVLFFTSFDAGVRRFDIESGAVSTLKLKSSALVDPWGIDCTPTGHLIVSCITTHSIYLIDPTNGEVELLAGLGQNEKGEFADEPALQARFNEPMDFVVLDTEHCIYVTDQMNNRIRRVTLPAHLFAVSSGGKQSGSASGSATHAICEERARAAEVAYTAELTGLQNRLHKTQNQLQSSVAALAEVTSILTAELKDINSRCAALQTEAARSAQHNQMV